MAYIGRGTDKISNIEVLDNITFTNSAGPYNITQSSTAFTPISPSALVISIDGIVQNPSSVTVNGSTLTFDTSMSSSSTMNFIYQIGVGLITTTSDNTITTAKIVDDAVTTAKLDNLAVTNAKVADDAVGLDELSATGTPSASNYLRGDNSWASVAADTNDKVGVSADDTTPGYLNGKLVAGANISLTEGSGGGDETLTAAFTGSLNASVLNAGTVATARLGSGTADGTTFLRGDQTYAAAGGGKVNQVQYGLLTSYAQSSTTVGSWADITGLNVSITPSATNSIIYIQYSVVSCTSGGDYSFFNVLRDIAGGGYGAWTGSQGDADSTNKRVSAAMPFTTSNNQITTSEGSLLRDNTHNTTSAITYKVQFISGGGTFRINRPDNATTGSSGMRSLSYITATEILA